MRCCADELCIWLIHNCYVGHSYGSAGKGVGGVSGEDALIFMGADLTTITWTIQARSDTIGNFLGALLNRKSSNPLQHN